MDTPQRIRLSPLKWNGMTWTLFVLWLLFSISENIPIEPELPDSSGTTPAPYSMSVVIGWPFAHTEFRHTTQTASSSTRDMNVPIAFVDILLIAIVQFAIVVVVQRWFRVFTLRTLFLFTTLIAVVLMLGRLAFASEHYHAVITYMYVVYFLPVAIWLCAMLLVRCRSATNAA